MAELGVPFHLTEIDGVPCFWADVPGPSAAGLLFRVGRADEQLAAGGITRLAARGGQVQAATTAYYFTGAPEDLAAALERMCGTLHEQGDREPVDPDGTGEPDVATRLLMMRFGAAGFGLAFYEEFGLRWLTADHVASWARERFTAANAAVWMTCPPPASMRLPLPPGARMPPPRTDPMPGLELPAFAASGDDGVASTLVSDRSTAMGLASRAAASRVRALGREVDAWQFPLTGDAAHRHLAVACGRGDAPGLLDDILRAFDAVASDGPTSDELEAARAALVDALAADESAAGALEAMAVDELLGAPRTWKEDTAAAAEAVSYAEAAAAMRSALASQIVLAPAGTAKPQTTRQLVDFPWFSRTPIRGAELRPDRRHRKSDARLTVSQEGVSHVAGDRASTVRFADVAAALQEGDGSLTLIGRDGAIVPLDPTYFKGAGQIVTDLERRLPHQLIVPPADTSGVGIEQLARRKLRPRWNIDRTLQLLRQQLDHEEEPVTLAEAVVGVKHGLMCVTTRRVIWVGVEDRGPLVREFPYTAIVNATTTRFPSAIVTLRSHDGDTAFSQVRPKERADEIADEVRRRAQYVARTR